MAENTNGTSEDVSVSPARFNQFVKFTLKRLATAENEAVFNRFLIKKLLLEKGLSEEEIETQISRLAKEFALVAPFNDETLFRQYEDLQSDTQAAVVRFAGYLAQASAYTTSNLYKEVKGCALKANNRVILDAVNECYPQIIEKKLPLSEGFALRPDVFFDDFIRALRQAETDKKYSKNLRQFISDRNNS